MKRQEEGKIYCNIKHRNIHAEIYMQRGGGEERQSLESKRVNWGKCLHYFLEETFVA